GPRGSRERPMNDRRPIVYVIDNDPSMRPALAGLVGSIGLQVRAFASPQEFLESKQADSPGCLVLDIRLPGMSGLSFQKELVKAGVPLPVLFITGDGEHPYRGCG